VSDEIKAIHVDLVGLLEIERGSQQRAQLEWAIKATMQIHDAPALVDQLCLLRRLAFVMATQLQTRQAWNLIGQFFTLLGTTAADAAGESVRSLCEQYALDVLVLGAKLQRPSAPDSAAQFKLWCGALRRFAPWRAIDLALLQLEADVHHGAVDFESAHRRLTQLLRRVHEAPDGTRRAGSFGPTTSSRRRSQKIRSVVIPSAGVVAAAGGATPSSSGTAAGAAGGTATSSAAASSQSTPTLALAIDVAAEEHRQRQRMVTFARILVLSYCLRAELSPLSLERMRDVLRNSDGESSDDGSGDSGEHETSSVAPADAAGEGSEAPPGGGNNSARRRRRRSMRVEPFEVEDTVRKTSNGRDSSVSSNSARCDQVALALALASVGRRGRRRRHREAQVEPSSPPRRHRRLGRCQRRCER
jgi:hypothetical protein